MGLCDESELVLVVPGFTEPVFFECRCSMDPDFSSNFRLIRPGWQSLRFLGLTGFLMGKDVLS